MPDTNAMHVLLAYGGSFSFYVQFIDMIANHPQIEVMQTNASAFALTEGLSIYFTAFVLMRASNLFFHREPKFVLIVKSLH